MVTDEIGSAWHRNLDLFRQGALAATETGAQIASVQFETLQAVVDSGHRLLREIQSHTAPGEPASWPRMAEVRTQWAVENMKTCVESVTRAHGILAAAIETRLPAISAALVEAMALWPAAPTSQRTGAGTVGEESAVKVRKAA